VLPSPHNYPQTMNNFFCEIPFSGASSQSAAIGLANVFNQSFPFQSGPCNTHQTPDFFLWGNGQVSRHEGHSALYLVGEIYNLNELGQSTNDENAAAQLHTLLLRQGTNAIGQCNGRFFVLYHNIAGQTIEVFNDQMGIQQLYYHQHAGGLIMASELKFLLAHPQCPQRINWRQSIRRSLGFNLVDHCQHQNAWFEGITMLPEASRIRIQPRQGDVQITPYWQPTYRPEPYGSAEEVMEAYMSLLADAVRVRCRDSTDAWAFLSGGLDSSIICALAAPHHNLHTYSALTQTTYLEQTTEMCFNLAQYLNCQNTQVVMPYHRIALDPLVWKKRLWRSESPGAHTDSITKTLLHSAITDINPEGQTTQARYILTGTGSDQLNGGLARWLVDEDEQKPDNNWTNLIGRLDDEALKPTVPPHYATQWGLRHVLHPDYLRDLGGVGETENNWLFYIQNNLYLNQYTLLWDENRAGSSQNRSVRYPFLDYRFMEFIGSIPPKFHAQLFYDKQILRHPAARYLPDYIINKPKAPAQTGDYDNRVQQYKTFVNANNRAVVEELMANNGAIGTVISRQKLQAEVERLETSNDHMAWQYLLHVLNLGVLEKLPQQTENSMRYENVLNEGSMLIRTLDGPTLAQIEAKLDIVTEAQKMTSVIGFKSGSSLVVDRFSNALFLMKGNVMHYEIDEDELAWKAFLLGIDGQKSVSTLLQQTGGAYSDIRVYLDLCLKEGFLVLSR